VGGQVNATADLLQGDRVLVSNEQEAVWVPCWVWTLCRRDEALSLLRTCRLHYLRYLHYHGIVIKISYQQCVRNVFDSGDLEKWRRSPASVDSLRVEISANLTEMYGAGVEITAVCRYQWQLET
jgi:hypothetical protein